MRYLEPKWKSLMANTTTPLFTPEQCRKIIEVGHSQPKEIARVGVKEKGGGAEDTKKRITHISWIPFKALPEMYKVIETTMLRTNANHFGFEGVQLNEPAQFTEYPKGGFYDWHMDSEVNCQFEPPVRKISMTVLLSDPSEFKGGDLEFMTKGTKPPHLQQGQAVFFASFIRHRVAKVTKGVRRSLVMWFNGPPFK